MRDDLSRIADIRDAALAIMANFSDVSENGPIVDSTVVDAAFFNVMVIGEAVRALLADPEGRSRVSDAEIIATNPDVPWRAWVAMRNLLAHQYYRRDPEIIRIDVASGEYQRLVDICAKWMSPG
jgi:uncharacterized protein with HEPN domain